MPLLAAMPRDTLLPTSHWDRHYSWNEGLWVEGTGRNGYIAVSSPTPRSSPDPSFLLPYPIIPFVSWLQRGRDQWKGKSYSFPLDNDNRAGE